MVIILFGINIFTSCNNFDSDIYFLCMTNCASESLEYNVLFLVITLKINLIFR